ncbi:hypothetical protein [uncultured Desulfobulbus sp.]|uniref:hypothetical protein n=1 Tax=uncultured Desulfobulbus sp. TaxID=239745 RepID=UPI0029C96F35|nr:hypothetical protein [uncultured Desulfobulbus sp.]
MSLADSNPLGLGTSWQEEILLHDGRTMVVDRSVVRGGGHEIGQKPPYKEQRLSFTMPDARQKITWEDHFSQNLGSSSFLPKLLDVHNNTAYLVVEPMGCLSYNKWGRPNPPYVIFKYVNSQWQLISLQELPAEIKTVNMISSMPDIVVERAGTSFMTKEMIQKIVSEYRQPEHQTIQREPLAGSNNCVEHIHTEKHKWLSIDWFSDQPNHEGCLKVCEREMVTPT